MDSGSASSGGTSEAAKPEAAATTATSPHPGCGCAASASASSSSSSSSLTVRVTPTTGGQFDLQASKTDTVETLKKLISKKLKVPKERICLLHRDRQLREGTLQENQLVDGSRLTLLPSVETGLLAQRPEQSVMQALESLNDSQVNDFLSGKAPLNLTMRLGDHMMLIQLQLSTVTPSGGRRSGASPSTSGASSTSRVAAPAASTSSAAPAPAASRHAHSHTPATSSSAAAASKPSPSPSPSSSSAAAAPEICRCDSSSSASGPASAAAAAARPTLDTRALAEASRNLTQTLKQLSSEDNARARRQGAIIESMHHHGKGVYSGTFSGTLNPALQDRFGRPKRDISTIIHILNDLLCATPQYRRHASRTQQQQQQPQQQQQQHHHHHHHHQQQQHHHQQHQQHAPGSHASTSAAVASSSAVAAGAAAGAGASAVPGKLITAANKVPHVAAIQSLSDESANLSRENQATRGKMEHLRLIMEERRARRRARREARAAPYTTQWSAKSEQLAPQSGVEPMDTTNSAEQSAPSTTTADVGPPEPVVA